MSEAPTFLRPITQPGADKGQIVRFETPFKLDSGKSLSPLAIAYMTYGRLNPEKSNAVLICHAPLTGDQFVASDHPGHRQARLVDHPGRPRQAHRYQPLLCDLRHCTGRLHGFDRPGRE